MQAAINADTPNGAVPLDPGGIEELLLLVSTANGLVTGAPSTSPTLELNKRDETGLELVLSSPRQRSRWPS